MLTLYTNDSSRCVMLVFYHYNIVFNIAKDFKNASMTDNL